jgi:ATP-dependent DNA helicase RecQ
MVSYADAAGCLRATILRYFGDPAAREPCDRCGNCFRRQRLDDEQRLLVRKILSGVARAGERFGRRKIAAMLAGQLDDLPDSLTRLSTTGLLRHESPQSIERWIDASVSAGLLRASDDQYRTLRLSPLGREVMSGRVEDVQIAVPPERASRSSAGRRRRPKDRLRPQISAAPLEAAAVALRAWRLDEARSRGVAPFVILHDRTLMAIASALPRTANDLLAIPGIGPAKVAAHGDAILRIVESSKFKVQS